MTASERAVQINTEARAWAAEKPGRVVGELVEDAVHWSTIAINTGAELDRYLAIEDYISAYKGAFGFRNRSATFNGLSTEEIERLTADIRSNEPF